jgi:hypothetical protein
MQFQMLFLIHSNTKLKNITTAGFVVTNSISAPAECKSVSFKV